MQSSDNKNDFFEEQICKAAGDFCSYAGDFFEDFDDKDNREINKTFKTALADYRNIVRACENEGLSVTSEVDDFKEEFAGSESISNRIKLIEDIRMEIVSMMEACSRPPKNIINKYSEDLVSRIENNIIDDDLFEVEED